MTACLAASGALVGCRGPDQQPSRADGWWFRADVAAGSELVYHAAYEIVTTDGPSVTRRHDEGDFTLAVGRGRTAGEPIIRLKPPDEQRPRSTDVDLWVQMLRILNQEGIKLTPTEVRVRDEPLLRGPWRKGDRMMLAAASIFPLLATVGHGEVESATADQAHLVIDFWGGAPLPEWRGHADLLFASDDRVVTGFRLQWNMTAPSAQVTGEVKLTLARIVGAGP